MTETALYAQRRARLAAQLGAGGIAIIPTAREQQRNRDSDFLFRHDSYFYYLTGFTEPHAWLVLTAEGEATLFCQPKDLEREIWDGIRLGPDAAPAELGVQKALPVTELAAQMPKLLENRSTLTVMTLDPNLEQLLHNLLQQNANNPNVVLEPGLAGVVFPLQGEQ